MTKTFVTNNNTKVYSDQVADLEVSVDGIIQILNVDYSVSDGVANNSQIIFAEAPATSSLILARIRFGSLIEASSYTMSYAGAGLSYNYLSPGQDGVGRSDPNKYTIARNQGRIYHTTTDESGDFYVGVVTPGEVNTTTGVQASARPSFRIDQQRGVIDGRSFYQSIFGFMAPFVLALTRRGK